MPLLLPLLGLSRRRCSALSAWQTHCRTTRPLTVCQLAGTLPQGKAVLRVEGLLSLTALVQLASMDSRAEAALGTVLDATLSKEGALLQPAAVARLGDDDAAALPKLTEVLLTQHLMRVETMPGATDTVSRLLVQLLLHASGDVRKHAASAAQAALGGSAKAADEVATALLKALRDWVVGTLPNPSLL